LVVNRQGAGNGVTLAIILDISNDLYAMFCVITSIKAYPAVHGCFKQKIVQATDGLIDILSSGLSETYSVNCYLFMPFFQ